MNRLRFSPFTLKHLSYFSQEDPMLRISRHRSDTAGSSAHFRSGQRGRGLQLLEPLEDRRLFAVNLVTNGSFESPLVKASTEFTAPSNGVSGWKVTGGTVDVVGDNPKLSFTWKAQQGHQSLDLVGQGSATFANSGTIEQDIPTTPGTSYTLQFAIAGNFYSNAYVSSVKTGSVSWGGKPLPALRFNAAASTASSMGWIYVQYTVTATSKVTPLVFKDTTANPFDAGLTLDDVSVTANRSLGIGGTVSDDANANGKLDPGENGLANIRMYIDSNMNGKVDAGEITTMTDASGNYQFTHLAAGTYRIAQVLPAGFVTTSPSTKYTDVMLSTLNKSGVNFLDAPSTASITGRVFSDTNGNGIRDPHESGLGLISVFIDVNDDGKLDAGDTSVVTDVLGNWSFTGLTAGTYVVRTIPVVGLSPTNNVGNHLTITLIAAQTSSGNLFGEQAIG